METHKEFDKLPFYLREELMAEDKKTRIEIWPKEHHFFHL